MGRMIPGGEKHLMSGAGNQRENRGVFSQFPGATPKYARNTGARSLDNKESMARLFVSLPNDRLRRQFVNSVAPKAKDLATALAGKGFIDFLLTSVQETFQEKYQVVESLSDNFIVYFFGQRAPTFQYGGTLLNTYQNDQRVWLMKMYQEILRGTQVARLRAPVQLRYDSVIVSGMMVGHGQGLSGDAVDHASFSLSMIPTHYTVFTPDICQPTRVKEDLNSASTLSTYTSGGGNTPTLRPAAPPATAPDPNAKKGRNATKSALVRDALQKNAHSRVAADRIRAGKTAVKQDAPRRPTTPAGGVAVPYDTNPTDSRRPGDPVPTR